MMTQFSASCIRHIVEVDVFRYAPQYYLNMFWIYEMSENNNAYYVHNSEWCGAFDFDLYKFIIVIQDTSPLQDVFDVSRSLFSY